MVLKPSIRAFVAYADVILVVDFYNQINLLYGAITEFCSPNTCPEMKATDEYKPSYYQEALEAKTALGSSIYGKTASTSSGPRRCPRPRTSSTS